MDLLQISTLNTLYPFLDWLKFFNSAFNTSLAGRGGTSMKPNISTEVLVQTDYLLGVRYAQLVMQFLIHSTTSTTDTSTTDSTRLTNAMSTSSDYLMKYFNGFLAVLLDQRTFCLRRKNPSIQSSTVVRKAALTLKRQFGIGSTTMGPPTPMTVKTGFKCKAVRVQCNVKNLNTVGFWPVPAFMKVV